MKPQQVFICSLEKETKSKRTLRVYVVKDNIPSVLGLVSYKFACFVSEETEVMRYLATLGNQISEKYASERYETVGREFIIKRV